MIIVCDVKTHMVTQSELMFIVWEVRDIPLHCMTVIIVCEHRLSPQIIHCWF